MSLPLLRSCLLAAALSGHLCAQTPATSPAPAASPKPKPPAATPKPAPPVLDQLGIKLIPQPGVKISDADRVELAAGVAALSQEIAALRRKSNITPEHSSLLPDVEIFHKAVDWALRYNEFFQPKQVDTARKLLEMGRARARELQDAKPSWELISGSDTKPAAAAEAAAPGTSGGRKTGEQDKLPAMLVRGYRSKIDGSIQPYGIVLPADYRPGDQTPRRLDFWCHGRGETLSELDFLNQRLTSKGEFTPPGTIVLHLYGRYCNANKFAGEVDLFEALADAKKHYKIDDQQIVLRGFSMGGAAVWQFATHFADKFAVVQPGAGFAETREFNKVYAPGKTAPAWWEEVLYRWYDATDSVANLSNTTTVAYSGEIDGQKQAADIMIRYARKDAGNANPPAAEPGKVAPGDGSPTADEARVTGTAPDVEFYHVIGPQTPHKIKPEAKPEIEKLIGAALAKHEAVPKKVRFTTYSLIYPQMEWVIVLGMAKQWERTEINAEASADGICRITTKNVTRFALKRPEGSKSMLVDGEAVKYPEGKYPRLARLDGKWQSIANGREDVDLAGACRYLAEVVEPFQDRGSKNVLTCGPIDHAFMSPFVFVKPTGKPLNDKVGAWVASEFDHAVGFWRKVFRGETPVKDDTAITDADLKNSNLVLWGDPSSNAVLKKILHQLPLKWDAQQLSLVKVHGDANAGAAQPMRITELTGQTYDATHTAPVLIFPNPLNPAKYIVLNSGPTFREDALLNNSQQIPKLPDWAIIDVNTPPDGKWPGQVLDAGFFDEQWKVPAAK